jgi:methyl-accepting chemotaxis protein
MHTDAIRAELQEKFGAQLQQLQVDFEQRIHAIQVELQAQSEVQVRAEIQRIRSGVDEQLSAFGGTIQQLSKSTFGVDVQIRAFGGTIQKLSKSSSDNVAIRSELCEHISRLQETTTALSLTMKQTEVKMARKLSIAVARSTEDTAATVDMLKQHLSEAEGRIYDLEQVLF